MFFRIFVLNRVSNSSFFIMLSQREKFLSSVNIEFTFLVSLNHTMDLDYSSVFRIFQGIDVFIIPGPAIAS